MMLEGPVAWWGFAEELSQIYLGHRSLDDPKLTQQRPSLIQFSENFAEHAEENFGVRGA